MSDRNNFEWPCRFRPQETPSEVAPAAAGSPATYLVICSCGQETVIRWNQEKQCYQALRSGWQHTVKDRWHCTEGHSQARYLRQANVRPLAPADNQTPTPNGQS